MTQEDSQNQSEIPENSVMFLIGAGCSAEAGVRMASDMVSDIEKFVVENHEWTQFKDLYNYLKSSILFSDGIFGRFPHTVNIEKLLVVITELGKKELNGLYPFVGGWNNRLLNLAGDDFRNLKEFGNKISRQLFEWINIPNYAKANYYKGFADFKKEIGYPIKIFSFNYDLCLEQIVKDLEIELGFDPQNSTWGYTNFEFNENKDVGIYLYKLHGSIDWLREKKGNILQKAANPVTDAELIFGTNAKLTSIDPYLFYVFEFRKYSLSDECKLIIVIGYSFEDEYMNKLMAQSLASSPNRKVLIVDYGDPEALKTKFVTQNGINPIQVDVIKSKASDFLLNELKKDKIYLRLPQQLDSAFQ